MPRSSAGFADDSGAMDSPLLRILLSAEDVDLEFMVDVLKSPVNLSADGVMDQALDSYKRELTPETKHDLARILEREIRYAGSSELAYFCRWMLGDDAGVEPHKLLADVADKLDVKLRTLGSFEARLERLVRAVVEKELLAMTPEQQRDLVKSHGVGATKAHELLHHLKQKGPVGAIPLLVLVAGREAAEKIVTALAVRVIAIVVGKEAAAHLIGTLAGRFPWWTNWVGPVGWAATSAWLALDLQGPAFRKTVPITLCLGLIALRDGDDGFVSP